MASLILSGVGGALFGPLGSAAGALAGSLLDNAAARALLDIALVLLWH